MMDIRDLASKDWFKSPEKSAIWASCFRIADYTGDGGGKEPFLVDVAGARAAAVRGPIDYLGSSTTGPLIVAPGQAHPAIEMGPRKTTADPHFLILAPYIVDGVQLREADVKMKVEVVAAILSTIVGRNAVETKIFELVLHGDGRTTARSPIMRYSGVFPPAHLDTMTLAHLRSVGAGMQDRSPAELRRLQLALHWYDRSLRDDGVDSFIQAWIALEVLGMADSNIRPINAALEEIYGLSSQEIGEVFCVGRIYNLRSMIMHDGAYIGIHYRLVAYVHALFSDLLLHLLKLPPQKRGLAATKAGDFVLRDYLERVREEAEGADGGK